MKSSVQIAHAVSFIFKRAAVVLVCAQFLACSSKPVKDDPEPSASANSPTTLTPDISSKPLDFSVQGSDSQKIRGLSTIHFNFDSALIPKAEGSLVTQNVAWMKAHPNFKMQIEGNCDGRGSVEYNLALGERRAKVVYRALVEQGIDKARLTTISYGKERPLVQGDSEAAYAQNRRANFVPLNAPANQLSLNDTN